MFLLVYMARLGRGLLVGNWVLGRRNVSESLERYEN